MRKNRKLLSTLLLFNSFSLGIMHLINKVIIHQSQKNHLLKNDAGDFYRWKFGSVYYEKRGDGYKPPFLLFHDMELYSTLEEWRVYLADLQKKYTVYVVDLPGFGRSDKPAITYTNYFFAVFCNHFIEDIIKEPVKAASFGSSSDIILSAALLKPAFYTSLTFINPDRISPVSVKASTKEKTERILLTIPIIGTSYYHLITNRQHLISQLSDVPGSGDYSVPYNHYLDLCYESAHSQNSTGRFFLSSKVARLVSFDGKRAICGLSAPLKLVFTDRGEEWKRIADQYKKYKKKTRVFTITESKSMLYSQKSAELTNLLLS